MKNIRMLNILFLDFDGVLNHLDFYKTRQRSGTGFDPSFVLDRKCIAHLNLINAEVPSFGVVVSSTWRLGRSIHTLDLLLSDLGFVGPVIGKTDDLRTSTSRGDTRHLEIRKWLRERRAANMDVRSFAVVDDEVVRGFGRRFIRTDFRDGGLTKRHAKAIVTELSRPHRWRSP